MSNIRQYVLRNFTTSFYTIFVPFLLIISLVFLIRISILTSKIQMTFGEMFELYLYFLPDILYYTIPLSFVTALANTLTRLSLDNELIALYSVGLKASGILKYIFYLGFFFSAFLMVLSYAGMTLGKEYSDHFIYQKKNKPSLNLSVGELGQKFGDLYVYTEAKVGDRYKNMVIYNRTKADEEQFFVADEGEVRQEGEVTSLKLYNGFGYTYMKDKLKQAKYETLEVFHSDTVAPHRIKSFEEFWSVPRNIRRGCFYLYMNLVPLSVVFLVAAFTMINPRYHKNNSNLVIFLTLVGLYAVGAQLEKLGDLNVPVPLAIVTFFIGYYLFNKKVARYF